MPSLEVRKLRHRTVKALFQSCGASDRQDFGRDGGHVAPSLCSYPLQNTSSLEAEMS